MGLLIKHHLGFGFEGEGNWSPRNTYLHAVAEYSGIVDRLAAIVCEHREMHRFVHQQRCRFYRYVHALQRNKRMCRIPQRLHRLPGMMLPFHPPFFMSGRALAPCRDSLFYNLFQLAFPVTHRLQRLVRMLSAGSGLVRTAVFIFFVFPAVGGELQVPDFLPQLDNRRGVPAAGIAAGDFPVSHWVFVIGLHHIVCSHVAVGKAHLHITRVDCHSIMQIIFWPDHHDRMSPAVWRRKLILSNFAGHDVF